jgi:pyridoxamine--pyruvate transaminase
VIDLRRSDNGEPHQPPAAAFTLTAGPVMTSPEVRSALAAPLPHHHDPLFVQRFRDTELLLRDAFQTAGDIVLMQGGAALGLEAAARAVARPGCRCLNLITGIYGASLSAMLRECGADVYELRVPYDEAIAAAEVERALANCAPIDLVSLVHCETPSGVENPLGEIAPIAHKFGALVLADVVSSLGSAAVRVDEWSIDLAVGASHKSLGGPPGISPVAVSRAAWHAIQRNPGAPRHSYLSLLDWKRSWIDQSQKRASFPHTPSVAGVAGLHAALAEIRASGGIEHAVHRHARAAGAVRAGVRAAGLELWPRSDTHAASCVTAVRAPGGVDVVELIAHVRQRHGVMLSGSVGELADKVVRLAHMGPACRSLYPLVAFAALGLGLADLGVPIDLAAGIDALLAGLSEPARAVPGAPGVDARARPATRAAAPGRVYLPIASGGELLRRQRPRA